MHMQLCFDPWWKYTNIDTNIGLWGWQLLGGFKNTIDQVPNYWVNTFNHTKDCRLFKLTQIFLKRLENDSKTDSGTNPKLTPKQ